MAAMPFLTKERDLLRRELCRHFGEDARIADGIFLRTCAGASGEARQRFRQPSKR